MAKHRLISTLRPGLFLARDTCNVFVVQRSRRCIAIDFGSGRWLSSLSKLRLPPLTDVFLTHHHADQCEGLLAQKRWPFRVHAPLGDVAFLAPAAVRAFWKKRRKTGGVPPSYSVLPRGLSKLRFDMVGFIDLFLDNERIRFLSTPGHGPHALTIVLDHRGEQIAFCGDAAHAGATIRQPYHLEWDHWTGSGALAAWEGVRRLAEVRVDLLCPSHGPIVPRPRRMLQRLGNKLLAFYHAKGNISPDEPDDYIPPLHLTPRVRRLLPDLFQFGGNGYLLRSRAGEALVIDPQVDDLDALDDLLNRLRVSVTAATATHYHCDHVDGLPALRKRKKARIYLHPRVAEPLRRPAGFNAPWLVLRPIIADAELPERGLWKWNEYAFRVAPFPGQTWWHACFMTSVNGVKVMFGGDNFQPNTRWNGTGGFSSINGSRFREGFARSAALMLRWRPDIVVCGHNTYSRYRASKYRKILAWSRQAEGAVRALCPSGELEKDYHLHKAY